MSVLNDVLFTIKGIGSRRTISMSNTRKMTANKKKRREKGKRAELFGSNPHSKGDAFSRSLFDRALRTIVVTIITVLNRRATVNIISVRCMSFGARVSPSFKLKA